MLAHPLQPKVPRVCFSEFYLPATGRRRLYPTARLEQTPLELPTVGFRSSLGDKKEIFLRTKPRNRAECHISVYNVLQFSMIIPELEQTSSST